MTIKELIEELSAYEEDGDVGVSMDLTDDDGLVTAVDATIEYIVEDRAGVHIFATGPN